MGTELARTATRLAAGMYDVKGAWPTSACSLALKDNADVIYQMWPER